MTTAHSRLRAFCEWRGLRTQQERADALGITQGNVSRIERGGSVSLALAHAIERLTSEPRADGEVWPEGPIRTEEWLVKTEAA